MLCQTVTLATAILSIWYNPLICKWDNTNIVNLVYFRVTKYNVPCLTRSTQTSLSSNSWPVKNLTLTPWSLQKWSPVWPKNNYSSNFSNSYKCSNNKNCNWCNSSNRSCSNNRLDSMNIFSLKEKFISYVFSFSPGLDTWDLFEFFFFLTYNSFHNLYIQKQQNLLCILYKYNVTCINIMTAWINSVQPKPQHTYHMS